jgi:hypothetical protein
MYNIILNHLIYSFALNNPILQTKEDFLKSSTVLDKKKLMTSQLKSAILYTKEVDKPDGKNMKVAYVFVIDILSTESTFKNVFYIDVEKFLLFRSKALLIQYVKLKKIKKLNLKNLYCLINLVIDF